MEVANIAMRCAHAKSHADSVVTTCAKALLIALRIVILRALLQSLAASVSVACDAKSTVICATVVFPYYCRLQRPVLLLYILMVPSVSSVIFMSTAAISNAQC